jgi:methanogenic corrinoid protein MtbC1
LYSEHDIELIKWLIARQNEGLSISRAVELWKENITVGKDPLAVTSSQQTGLLNLPNTHPLDSISPVSNIDHLRSRWLDACLDFNEIAAEGVLNQAFALYPVETVCVDVLQRGMVDIGALWYENRASIQQEHFASALAMRRLDALISAAPTPTRGKTVIVCCPANEWHAFTPLLISLFVRRRGINVIYLGANVPSTHLVETVRKVKADMVVLASQQLITAASLQESAALVSAQGTIVAFGGRIFAQHPNLVNCIAGNYLGSRLDAAIGMIENLLAAPTSNRQPVLPSLQYEQSLKAFITNRSFVEAGMDGEMVAKGINTNYFSTAHKFMGDNIIAALHLGDMSYLDSEIDWLNVLVEGYHLPKSVVFSYLAMYSQAVQTYLGEHAGLLVEWFENQLAGNTETAQ